MSFPGSNWELTSTVTVNLVMRLCLNEAQSLCVQVPPQCMSLESRPGGYMWFWAGSYPAHSKIIIETLINSAIFIVSKK